MADVSTNWVRVLVRNGVLPAVMVGGVYLIPRAAAAKFKRIPGMGRPRGSSSGRGEQR